MNYNEEILNLYKESIGNLNKTNGFNIIKCKRNNIVLNVNHSKLKENKINEKKKLYEERGIFQIKYFNNLESETINIFGEEFIKENRKNFELIINHKEKELKSIISIAENHLYNQEIKIYIKFKKIVNTKFLKNNTKINTYYIKDLSCMFEGCSTLFSLPDLSKWNTNEVTYINNIFKICSSLEILIMIHKITS